MLLALAFAAACSFSAPTGVPFEQAFPDPSELVTTTDPAAVHTRLGTTALPTTRAHHDRLVALLRSRNELTAAQLALLARAAGHGDYHSMTATNVGTWHWPERGEGACSATIDQLLSEGLPKVSAVDRRWYGELIGLTQNDLSTRAYIEALHARVDDGSPEALREILGGMPGSPATVAFLRLLATSGKLDEARGWVAFDAMSFDEQRCSVLGLQLERGAAVDGKRLVATMRAFTFDDARRSGFELLLGKANDVDFADVEAAIGTFTFDDGKRAAAAALAKTTRSLTDADLVTLVRMFTFDEGRGACVSALAGRLTGDPDAASASALLRAFTFDDQRLATTRVLASRWQRLSAVERKRLGQTFTFDESRDRAIALLQ